MHINKDGLELIKSFEGCRLKAYKLKGEKYYTIGYGHSFDESITADTVWTMSQAENALKKDLERFEAQTERYLKLYGFNLNENQFSALVSYCYNRGVGGLRELICNSTIKNMADNIVKYWGSAERYKLGLIKRRKAERNLFLKECEDMTKDEVKEIVKEVLTEELGKKYTYTAECPQWSIDTVQALLDTNSLATDKGTFEGLTKKDLRLLVIINRFIKNLIGE